MKPSTRQPTRETYDALDQAYGFFNLQLFGGRLPRCVITLNRRRGNYGYFWADTWAEKGGSGVSDEISLNPDHFRTRSLKKLLSTLVHEMCHLEQHHFGKPTRNRYHNKEWGTMMERVGLVPSNTGKKGGKRTGQKVTHFIQPAGPYDQACTELIEGGFKIAWQASTTDPAAAAAAPGSPATARRKAKAASTASKTKYSCGGCGLNAWAKPGANLQCGDCDLKMAG